MKRSFIWGINKYTLPGSDLRGCVPDAVAANTDIIAHFGFTDAANRRVLLDHAATTVNILDRLWWLVSGVKAGDELFVDFSSHGSQVFDVSGDEAEDGMDEVACPSDMDFRKTVLYKGEQRPRYILDDDFAAIFSNIPEGVNLTVVADCCTSGSIVRAFGDPDSPVRNRHIDTPYDISNRALAEDGTLPRGKSLTALGSDKPFPGILISGCQDGDTSADSWFHNSFRGALSYYRDEILRDYKFHITYANLHCELLARLSKNGYSQRPVLYTGSGDVNRLYLGGRVS